MKAIMLRAALSILTVVTMEQMGLAQRANKFLIPGDAVLELASPIGRWPEFAAGQKRRVHVWYEKGVWHFRSTCGGNATIFDGTVTLDKGAITLVGGEGDIEQRGKAGKLQNANKADYVQLTPNGMAFRLQSFGKLDGLDFVVPKEAKKIRFEFIVNNESKAEYIFIGANGEQPAQPAFTLPAHPK